MWQNFVGDVIARTYDVIWRLFQKTFPLRRPGVAFFASIIKIFTMFIITIYTNSRKVKINRNYVSKCNLYLYFLIQQNLLISSEKMLVSAELKGCVTWFIFFLDLLWLRYNCAKFHCCRICATDFVERGLSGPLPSVSSPEIAHPE